MLVSACVVWSKFQKVHKGKILSFSIILPRHPINGRHTPAGSDLIVCLNMQVQGNVCVLCKDVYVFIIPPLGGNVTSAFSYHNSRNTMMWFL